MMKQLNLVWQAAGRLIDGFNDRLTSYRLMLYFLLALIVWAIFGSLFHQVPYHWYEIIYSAAFLLAVCWSVNKSLSKLLDIPANKESDLISALILTLIMTPAASGRGWAALAIAGIVAMASKYLVTVYKSHVFNPAAAGAFIAGIATHQYAAWWVGTKFMTPVVLIGGILIMRKMKRFTMVASFFAIFILWQVFGISGGANLHYIWSALISTQLLFFGYVMLTEPQTSPTAIEKYLPYALIVGIFYSVTKIGVSPEAALLIGNLAAFIIAPKRRYAVKFIKKTREADGIFTYAFSLPAKFSYKAGQYMEWTLPHNRTDSRGNRRYFTLSSSPTEDELMFTVKHPPEHPSAFKQKLDELKPGETILASYLAGSFSLPQDTSKKLAFLAGGVGITPFRSMAKYLIDSGEKRDTALLYSAASPAELAFDGLFKKAESTGLKIGFLTDRRIDRPTIATFIPDYAERTFYVSGPYGFVKAIEASLTKMGLPAGQIKTDYFPGYGS
jgi:ferredoxin-NADP reductase